MDGTPELICPHCGGRLEAQLHPRPGPPRPQLHCPGCRRRLVDERRRVLQDRSGLGRTLIDQVPEAMLLYVEWEAMSCQEARAFTLRLIG